MNVFDLPWVPRSFLRTGLGVALGLLVGSATGCTVTSVFTCVEDQDCIDEIENPLASCEVNSLCSVPDIDCPSGHRWHSRASDFGGQCLDPADLGNGSAAGTAGGSTGGGDGNSNNDDDSATVPGDSSTTDPVDDSGNDDDTSGDPPAMTDDGGSSSSGSPAASCDELFGDVPAYELCDETNESCSFNAMTNGDNCDMLCMGFDSTCVTAFQNDMSDCASQGAEVPCAEAAMDNICVCAK